MVFKYITVIILLLLSAFFSSSETAFTSLSISQIESLAARKGARGRLVKKLLKKPEHLLTTILTGNNLVNISLTAITTEVTIKLFGNSFIGIMTGVLTLTVLIFGEVIPKNLAIAYNEQISVFSAPVIKGFMVILRPFVNFISWVSTLVTSLIGVRPKDRISMDSILLLIRYAEAKGVVEDYENDMVHGVFRLAQQNIVSIMTHRTDVFSLDGNDTLGSSLPKIMKSGFSRIPIYENGVENITGSIYIKDILNSYSEIDNGLKLKEISRPPIFISGNRKVGEVLFLMKKEKKKMAIVLDEYSGLSGLVTMEDILEEVVGEMYDENEERLSEKIVKRNENEYFILGNTPISMLNDRIGIHIPIGRLSQTLGGFIIDELGRIPSVNEKIVIPSGELTVNSVSSRKVKSVILRLKRR